MGSGQTILISNISLIDGTGTAPQPNASVLIRNGKFEKIFQRQEQATDATVIDGAGKFLLPGLFDMHAHLLSGGFDSITDQIDSFDPETEKRALMQMLYWGVTTVFNPVQPLATAEELRNYESANPSLSPRVLLSGPGFTAPGGWAGSFLPIARLEPDEPKSAREQVNTLADASVDFLKVYYDGQCCAFVSPLPKLKKAVMQEIVTTAHTRKLKVMVHAYDVENHLDALRAGADIMAHSAVTAPVNEEYLRLSRKNNVMYLATLSAYHDAFNPSALREFISQDFVQKSVPKKTLSTLASGGPLDGFLTSVKASFIAGQWPVILGNLKAIFDRGVPIAVGPDTGIMGAFPGISVHRELELMAEASIPASSLLAAATSVPAKYLGLHGLGVIEEGAIADAVITTKNPSTDIRDTRTVETVIKGGVVVDRAELLRKILSN